MGDELSVGMDVNLPESLVTAVHEFVPRIGRDDDDLSGMRLKYSRTYRKGSHTLLDDENLLVRMLMQPYATPGRHVDPNEGHLRILILEPLELVGIPIMW